MVTRAIIPGVVAGFLMGVFGLGHLWAGAVLAVVVFAYGFLLPQWLWRHVQRRGGAT
jgi:hypothetical protein